MLNFSQIRFNQINSALVETSQEGPLASGDQVQHFWQILAEKISMLVPQMSTEQLNAAVYNALDAADVVSAPLHCCGEGIS